MGSESEQPESSTAPAAPAAPVSRLLRRGPERACEGVGYDGTADVLGRKARKAGSQMVGEAGREPGDHRTFGLPSYS
ncbi:hypothetical protein GCM10010449_00660 [Streptomyces rectiviolaceus]|uniref:Uncharacterized protein n=1 Tax=Streptomyces rectiviolaceus TaxID=332591 RepID=A0ABP6M8Y8_9ACTN